MRCPACSATIPEGDSRCPGCGAGLYDSVPTAPLPESPREVPELTPGASFANRYTIIQKAGAGGMGVVYKAIDNSLDLVVALKVLRADLAGNPAFVERFKQEVRLTRQIAHPNVCRVHDLGDVGGILFLSMEWIEGETLRRRLWESGPLEPRRAMEIVGKTLQALGAAHSRGIVHRDLKPENVMIDHQGSVFVMDYGVALGPGEGSQADARFGTPSYMAPEQVRGGPVDHRTDLFALGLLLREMLAGGRAGEPESHQLHERLPRGIRSILETLLSEDPKNRRVTPEEIDRVLRSLQPASGSATGARRFVRVLGRPSGRLLLGGMGIAVILALSLVPRILKPRDSDTANPGGLPASAADPFYRRGVYYLRAEGETARSLNEAIQMLNRAVEKDPSSSVAWANLAEAYWMRYERMREPSSREEALRAQERAFQQNPDLPEALNAKGRGLIATGDFAAAVAELKRAVRKKPDFDPAWANLGMAYGELKDGYRPGLQALQTAIRLSPKSFRHRVYLGLFFYRFGEYDQAEKASRKAIDLKPDSVMAWNNLGAIYLQMDRPADAVSAFQESLKLEEGAHAHSNLGTAYYFQKDFGQALEHYRRATKLEPHEAGHWGNLGDAFRMLKNSEEARGAYLEAVQRAREKLALLPQDPGAHMSLGLYCARAHEEACALEEGGKAESMQPDSLDVAFTNAVILAILGKTDAAMEHLERAVKLGLSKVQIENDPDLAPLRDLPRYRRILELAG